MAKHTEESFEATIVDQMKANGWRESNHQDYDRVRCMMPEEVYEFILATQPKEWEKLHAVQGSDAKESLLQRIYSEVSGRGTIAVLRKGVEHLGCHFKLCYFPPSSGLNEDSGRLFESNILTVVRQLRFSTNNEKSIDLVLFVNGLPIFTSELKNPLTGQDVYDAVLQYKNDRNPKGEASFSLDAV